MKTSRSLALRIVLIPALIAIAWGGSACVEDEEPTTTPGVTDTEIVVRTSR